MLHLCAGGFQLLLCGCDSGARALDISLTGQQLAGGADGSDGNVDSCGYGGGLRGFKVRLGAIVGDLIVGRIDLH